MPRIIVIKYIDLLVWCLFAKIVDSQFDLMANYILYMSIGGRVHLKCIVTLCMWYAALCMRPAMPLVSGLCKRKRHILIIMIMSTCCGGRYRKCWMYLKVHENVTCKSAFILKSCLNFFNNNLQFNEIIRYVVPIS